jgi:hypothetical protein
MLIIGRLQHRSIIKYLFIVLWVAATSSGERWTLTPANKQKTLQPTQTTVYCAYTALTTFSNFQTQFHRSRLDNDVPRYDTHQINRIRLIMPISPRSFFI